MQDLAHQFAIGNHHARTVAVEQGGREQFDGLHLSADADDLDEFADSKRFCENNCQPGHQIAQDALHGEANAHAGHADAGNHRSNRHAKFVQGQNDRQPENQQPDHPHRKNANRRFNSSLAEPLVRLASNPARDERADGENNLRADDLNSVVRQKADDFLLHLVQGGSRSIRCLIHVSPQVMVHCEPFVK